MNLQTSLGSYWFAVLDDKALASVLVILLTMSSVQILSLYETYWYCANILHLTFFSSSSNCFAHIIATKHFKALKILSSCHELFAKVVIQYHTHTHKKKSSKINQPTLYLLSPPYSRNLSIIGHFTTRRLKIVQCISETNHFLIQEKLIKIGNTINTLSTKLNLAEWIGPLLHIFTHENERFFFS